MQEHLAKEKTRQAKQTTELERAYRLQTDIVSGIQHVNDLLRDIKTKPVSSYNACSIVGA